MINKFKLFLKRLDKLICAISGYIVFRALIKNAVLVGAEHRRVIQNVPLSTVVDIGANRGQFSLAIKQWAPEAVIYAFEPLSVPAQKFKKVFLGDDKVIFNQVAIGPGNKETIIHVSACDDSSSLLGISELQTQIYPGTEEIRTELIKVGKLCDFLSNSMIKEPAMLKIDVQGFELEVLRGSTELLKCFTQIYVECSFVELYTDQVLADEVISWLRNHGFKISGIYNVSYDRNGETVQADFLFHRA